MSQITQDMGIGSPLMGERSMQGYLSSTRCSGIMGVPITFLSKYNPEQFEILGMTKTPICYENTYEAKRKKQYKDVIQYSKTGIKSSGNKVNDGSVIVLKRQPSNSIYYVTDDVEGFLLAQFPRILIKHRR